MHVYDMFIELVKILDKIDSFLPGENFIMKEAEEAMKAITIPAFAKQYDRIPCDLTFSRDNLYGRFWGPSEAKLMREGIDEALTTDEGKIEFAKDCLEFNVLYPQCDEVHSKWEYLISDDELEKIIERYKEIGLIKEGDEKMVKRVARARSNE